MASLKNNIKKVSGDTESLAKNYLKLFSVRQSERLALFLGIVMSIFVVATLLLILVVFCSFALAGTLNKILHSEFWGFVIVGGLYIAWIIFLVARIFKTNTPLFANLFVKLITAVMNIDSDQANNLEGLKKEQEIIKEKIETDKTMMEADFQILKYNLLGSVFKEFIGLFSSKKKDKSEPVNKKGQEDESTNN